jgi:hypothetical protein
MGKAVSRRPCVHVRCPALRRLALPPASRAHTGEAEAEQRERGWFGDGCCCTTLKLTNCPPIALKLVVVDALRIGLCEVWWSDLSIRVSARNGLGGLVYEIPAVRPAWGLRRSYVFRAGRHFVVPYLELPLPCEEDLWKAQVLHCQRPSRAHPHAARHVRSGSAYVSETQLTAAPTPVVLGHAPEPSVKHSCPHPHTAANEPVDVAS